MLSKYESQGFVVVVDGEVDPEATLDMLDGRLDESKRQRAIAIIQNDSVPLTATRPVPAARPASSAKAQKDEVELELKRLDLALKAGEVVYVADVAETARQSVAALRESFDNMRKETASKLCARFDISADHVGAVSRFLKEEFEVAIGRFGQVAGAMASAPEPAMPPHLADSTAGEELSA